MSEPTRILIIEDLNADFELAKREISKSVKECLFKKVETRKGFLDALESFRPDVILSDYSLPQFDGVKALELAREHAALTPFIIWTGSLSEDVAVGCMKAGANNYILKENIKRLGPAVVHAMEERRLLVERKQAEEELHRQEKRFRSLIENSLDNISLLAADGTLLWENPAVNRTLGYEQDKFVNHNIFELMHPDDAGWTSELFAKLIREPGSQRRGTFRLRHQDGIWRWIEATATNMLNEPSVNAIVINYRDVTERKQSEIEIQHRNDDLRLMNAINEAAVHGVSLDGIVDMVAREMKRIFSSDGSTIYLLSPDGKSLAMQQYVLSPEIMRRIEKIIGSTIPLIQIPIQEDGFFQKVLSKSQGSITSDPKEIQKWMEEFVETTFLPPVAHDVLRKLIPQIYKILNITSVVTVPLISDGKTIGILDVSSPNLFTDEDLRRIENISRQLTAAIQRQQADKMTQRSEAFLQSVQNALSASIAILNEEGTIVQINSAWRKFGEQNGLKHPEYCIGLNYLEICDAATGPYAEEAPLVANAIREVIAGRKREVQIEYPCHHPEEKRWFILHITKFEDEDHIWVVLAHENITKRKLSEQALKETSEQFRTLFEASPDAIMLVDPQGDWPILDCNVAGGAMNGYTRDELVGQSVNVFNVTPGTPDERSGYLEQVRKAGILRYETAHRRKDGTIFPIEVSTSLVTVGGREVVLGIDRDITERKHAEEALRQSEALYRRAIEVAGAVPYYETYYDDGKAIKYEFIGEGIRQITGYGPEEFNAKVWDSLVEEVHLVEDLEGYSLNEGIQRVRSGEYPIWKCEHRIRARDGKIHWVFEAAVEMRDEYGVSHGSIGTYQDITKRKQAEDALRESEKRYRALFEDVPIAIWEEDFSEVKKYLDTLKQLGVTDFRGYFEAHPEAVAYCAEIMKVLDVNNTALDMFEADSKEELIRSTIEELSKGEQENNLEDLIAIAEGRTGRGWEGADETLKNKPIEISLNWSVFPGYEADYSKVIVTTMDITSRKQAEEALRQSESRYRTVVESQSEFIVRWKPNGERTFANEAYCRYFGIEPEQAFSTSFMPLIHEEDRAAAEEKISRLLSGTVSVETDIHRVIKADGSIGWQEWTDHAIYDRNGKLVEFQSVGRDITERKQVEDAEREQRALAEALRDTAEILNSTLEYGEVLDHILTTVGRVVPHDAATIMLIEKGTAHVARMKGYAERGFDNEIRKIELTLTETVNLQQMLKTRRPVVVSDTYSYPGWKVLPATSWLRSNVGAPISVFGEVVGFILLDSTTTGFFTPVHAKRLEAFANQAALAIHNARLLQQAQDEIAERKQAEKELRASEERFRQLANNIQEVFWITDVATNVDIYLSPAYEKIWGHPPEVQYQDSRTFVESILPEDRPAVSQKLDIQRSGKSTEMEYRIMRPDGSIRWIWDRAFPIFDDSGRVVSLAGIAADITERKKLEHERDLLSSTMSASLNEIFLFDADTLRFRFVNEGALRNLGYSLTEMLQMTPLDLKPELTYDSFQELLVPLFQQKKPVQIFETMHRRADGSLYPVEVHLQLFEPKGERVFFAVIQDITERKKAEDELRESEERFSSAFEFAPIGIALVSLDGRWMKVNHAICDLLGYTEEQLLATTFQDITDPNDLDTNLNHVRQMLAGEINSYQMEKRYIHKSSRLVWVLLSVSLIKDRLGNPKYFISQIQDITERKQAEAETRRHLLELEALYENGLAVGHLLEPRAIGELIIKTFSQYFSWHHVTIRLRKENTNKLDLIAFNLPHENGEMASDVESHFLHISKVGQGISGWVVQTGQSVRTGNLQDHPKYVQTYENMRSGLYMPLQVGDRVFGVISVESEESNAFSEQDERLLATLATQAAIAFENARLYQSVQRERERFLDLFEHSPVATWLEDFTDVIAWMDGLRAKGVKDLNEYFESNPEDYKTGVGLIRILDVNQAAVVMNGARDKQELIGIVNQLMVDEVPSQVMINEMEMIWNGYTSFGFEISSRKMDGALITSIQRVYIPINNDKLDYARVIVTSTDITERINIEKELRASEVHYRELADSITDIFFELDQDLHYSHWNRASEALTGLSTEYAIGKSMRDVFGESGEQTRIEQIYREVLEKHKPRTFETTFLSNGLPRAFEINAYPSTRGVSVVAKDVTERKRTESLMQKRFELMEYSSEHSLQELMQKTLDEISEWTHSTIGFFQFIMEDQNTPSMQTWSTDTFQHFHSSQAEIMHKPADQAGVWAEAIRQRRAIIHNDYMSLPGRKGLPEGHAPLVRELVVPIIRNEKIVAVIGIGNKPQDYVKDDLEIMERFADYAWDIIERKQMVMELAEERNQLAKRVEERTADLSRANSNLARALRVKDEFLANMSHELRTPLNAILGLSESLTEQIAGPLNEKQQKYLITISESGHHLLSLINDILDLAKIEAGQITLDINKVDVNSVSQASLRMIKQLAQKKNLEVLVEIDKNIGLIWADERRLKQMIVNLMSNAVKFTPENGKIGLKIQGQPEDNKVMITVWDTGIGIRESDFQRLFQPFVQLDSGLARESTGTGLGLALVTQMARLHGGSVNVTSDPGKGSRFTIVLPWEPAVAMDAAEKLKATGKFRAIKPGQEQQIILLIEDTQEVVMMIKDYLEIAGYKVVTAQDGIDGITQANLTHPDLILMDIQMPRMDGLEATQKLRQEPEFKYTPIIALTALAMPSDRERCLAAGMDEYISKPVNLRALVKIVQNCLSIREEKTGSR